MKTLIFDIETSPLVAYTWGAYEQNIIEEIEESKIISIAYKWLGEAKTHVYALPDFKGYKEGKIDDFELCKLFHKVIEEADLVVAHNGKAFDCKTMNTRFFAN